VAKEGLKGKESAMNSSFQHIFLSPHLDDVVLSCGGHIHQCARKNQKCLVVTIFAGAPEHEDDLSEYALEMQREWGQSAGAVQVRWFEDQKALGSLGADYVHLSYLDCIYRRHHGEWLYQSEEAIFGQIDSSEDLLPNAIAEVLSEFVPPDSQQTLYAPLTVGNHVDHQLTLAAGLLLQRRGWPLILYEDFPYAAREPQATAKAQITRGLDGCPATIAFLTEEDFKAKLSAIHCYASQLNSLFDAPEHVDSYTRRFAASIGEGKPAERLWILENRR
jgi:LmbE family N-acetylglucosaminyl deacetylase